MIKEGKQIVPSPSLESIRSYVQDQLAHEIWPEEQRFENPHRHYLDMSPDYAYTSRTNKRGISSVDSGLF